MDQVAENIQQNLERIQDKISQAAQSARRNPNDVQLVVVTKAQPVEVIQSVIQAGANVLGENYPEETQEKIQALGPQPGIQWHMIGHLQSRKAGIVASHFDMLQSLDSLHLAQKLDRLVEQAHPSKVLPVLLEVNVSGEESKSGFSGWSEAQWELLIPDFEQILSFPHLSVKGLMTMPPLVERPEENRPFFKRLSELRDYLNRRLNVACFTALSMGTSHDFEIAVEEGATYVRVGTAIVGPRPPKKTQ